MSFLQRAEGDAYQDEDDVDDPDEMDDDGVQEDDNNDPDFENPGIQIIVHNRAGLAEPLGSLSVTYKPNSSSLLGITFLDLQPEVWNTNGRKFQYWRVHTP